MADSKIKFPKECIHYVLKDGKQIPINEIGLDIVINLKDIGGHACEYCPTVSCFFREHPYIFEEITEHQEENDEEKNYANMVIRAAREVTETYGPETDLTKSCAGISWRAAQVLNGNKNPDEGV